jgi:hypothetical protein
MPSVLAALWQYRLILKNSQLKYVILRKLEYYREGWSEKHLRDIAGILDVSGAPLNAAWLAGGTDR